MSNFLGAHHATGLEEHQSVLQGVEWTSAFATATILGKEFAIIKTFIIFAALAPEGSGCQDEF